MGDRLGLDDGLLRRQTKKSVGKRAVQSDVERSEQQFSNAIPLTLKEIIMMDQCPGSLMIDRHNSFTTGFRCRIE